MFVQVKRFNRQWIYYAEYRTPQITWQTKTRHGQVKHSWKTLGSLIQFSYTELETGGTCCRTDKSSPVEELIPLSLAAMVFCQVAICSQVHC